MASSNEDKVSRLEDRIRELTSELAKTASRLVEAEDIITTSDLGVWKWNLGDNSVWFNDRYFNILGLDPNDFASHNYDIWEMNLHPDDKDKTLDVVMNCIENGLEGFSTEFRMKSSDGYKNILGTGRVVARDENGNPTRIVGTHMDLTNLRQKESELCSLQDMYKLILDSTSDAIILLNDQGQFVEANSPALDMFGYSVDEFMGMTPIDISPSTQPHSNRVSDDYAFELISASLRGHPQFFDWYHKKESGDIFETEVSLNKIRLKDKDFVVARVKDVSERKRYQRDLQQIVELATDGIFAIDDEGKIILWNSELAELTGLKSEDVLGKRREVYSRAFYNSPRNVLANYVLAGTNPPSDLYPDFSDVDGVMTGTLYLSELDKYFLISAKPLFDNFGNIKGAVEVLKDITAMKKEEEKRSFVMTHDSVTGFLRYSELKRRFEDRITNKSTEGNYVMLINTMLHRNISDEPFKAKSDKLSKVFHKEIAEKLKEAVDSLGLENYTLAVSEPNQYSIHFSGIDSFTLSQYASTIMESIVGKFRVPQKFIPDETKTGLSEDTLQKVYRDRGIEVSAKIGVMSLEEIENMNDYSDTKKRLVTKMNSRGKNQVTCAKDISRVHVVPVADIPHIEAAISLGLLDVYAMPLVNFREYSEFPHHLSSGQNSPHSHFELLGRYRCPDTNRIFTPHHFLALAEDKQYRTLPLIDKCTLMKAFHIANVLKQYSPNIHLSTNIGIQTIIDEGQAYIELTDQLIREYGFPQKSLGLEILEQDISSQNQSVVSDFVKEMRKRGFDFSMDDFGSKYSNEKRLDLIEFNALKIDGENALKMFKIKDGSFLLDANGHPQVNHLKVNGILRGLEIARERGLVTVVEGAETQHHVDYLFNTLGKRPDRLQGFYFMADPNVKIEKQKLGPRPITDLFPGFRKELLTTPWGYLEMLHEH